MTLILKPIENRLVLLTLKKLFKSVEERRNLDDILLRLKLLFQRGFTAKSYIKKYSNFNCQKKLENNSKLVTVLRSVSKPKLMHKTKTANIATATTKTTPITKYLQLYNYYSNIYNYNSNNNYYYNSNDAYDQHFFVLSRQKKF